VEAFARDGYLVLRRLADDAICAKLTEITRAQLAAQQPPLEYEADVGYPGAPSSREASGGLTVRRLRGVYDRDPAFRDWALDPRVCEPLRQFLREPLVLTLAHHNAVMTKHPHFGSATGWHRDNRYWSFTQPQLITAWLALGAEDESNGALRVIPGSHLADLAPGQLDDASFLVEDHPASGALVANAIAVPLSRGDLLFFDSRLFHSAGQNHSDAVKLSVAFAYHGESNRPVPGSRTEAGGSVGVPD
jgi:phytanoyl-CoA hydroxylase